MNIIVITQMFSQPDDKGDNKPTKTVNYFVKEWSEMGHNVIVFHCSTRFPLMYYYLPAVVTNYLVERTSCIVPPVESRKELIRSEGDVVVYRIPLLKLIPGQAFRQSKIQKTIDYIISQLVLRSFVPDVVVGHFANPSCEIVARLSQRYNVKSSIVFHGDCNQTTVKKYKLNRFIPHLSAIGARSKCEAHQIRSLLKLNKEPFVCYSGVPNATVRFAERECVKQDFKHSINFLYVGSLIKRKHVDSVIDAFNKLHRNDCGASLAIIGGGNEEKELKRTVQNLGINNISFLGRVSRDIVFQYMKEANIFTLISDEEVYGMVYIEAMLQGCLVIASKGGGFDGIIQDHYNGFLCNPGDSRMLLSIYREIECMSIDERNSIGNNAIHTALHYSEREVAERYLTDVLTFSE